MARRYLCVALALLFGTISISGGVRGPGLPTNTFDAASVFKLAARIPTSQIPNQHGTAVMVQGYAVVPYANNVRDGGFGVVDVHNPFSPVVQKLITSPQSREGHSIGFHRTGDQLFSVGLGSTGVLFWNWSDILNSQLVARLDLPGIEPSDYDNAAWWVFWQAPYVYVGGASRGLFVINAADPTRPFLANQVPAANLGLLRVGSVFAVGNLLFAAANDLSGFSVLDISDPLRPTLMFNEPRSDQYAFYSAMVNGNRLMLAGTAARQGLLLYDISNPRAPRLEKIVSTTDKGGYLTTQDGVAHFGSSDGYYKVVVDGASQGNILGVTRRWDTPLLDLDFVSVLGNIAMVGDDDGLGTAVIIHDRNPDTKPPVVNMVNPANGARDVPVTSRVGITLTDQIELDTLTPDAFQVRETATGAAVAGRLSGQTAILNFSPNQALKPGTEYQVVVEAGRLKDVAGNAIATRFLSRFTTAGAPPSGPCTLSLPTVAATGASVSLSIGGCVLQGGNTVTWNFGDGTTASGSGNVDHRFASAGHFVVLATIQDSSGIRTVQARVTVARTLTPQRQVHSSTIVLSERHQRLLVVNSDTNTVAALSMEGDRRLFETTVGIEPVSVAVDGGNGVWVANKGSDTISVLDARDGRLLNTLWTERGSAPSAIVYAPGRQRIYVSLEGFESVLEINPGNLSFGRVASVGPFPGGLALWPDESRLIVSRFISPADQGRVTLVGLDSFSLDRVVPLRRDPGPDTESSGRGVPNYLFAPAVSPDGTEIWVPSKKDDTERGQFLSGQPLTFENTVRAIVSRIGTGSFAELTAQRIDLDNQNLPAAVEFSPLGDYALVATAGSNSVDIVDAYSGQRFASMEHIGLSPRGLAVDTVGKRLYVQSLLSRDVVVVDISPLASGLLPAIRTSIRTIGAETVPAQILRGKQVFYDSTDPRMATDSYLSCGTCHFEGKSDLRVWDFTDRGEGLRKTAPLIGRGGTRHGPVHWTGNMDEVQDFETDIRNGFKGAGFMTNDAYAAQVRSGPLGPRAAGLSADLDALAAYVGSLTRLPLSPYRPWSLSSRAQNGKNLFDSSSVGCASCHTGAQLTDSAVGVLHDVGTIRPASGKRAGQTLLGFDTPTLRGIWTTAPYLHDGSAPTLRSVLRDRNTLNKHGSTAQLTDSQIDDIVTYLFEIE
jgi:DNA-binding beta-propeller fold protein YncE